MPDERCPEPREAVVIARGCQPVAQLAQKGVTHRDLKPDNIMIGEGDQAGRIKVLDFGLAKAMDAGHVGRVRQVRQVGLESSVTTTS